MRTEELIRRDGEVRVLREVFDAAYAVLGLPIHQDGSALRPSNNLDGALAPEQEPSDDANRNVR
jgi:hypothetical protein